MIQSAQPLLTGPPVVAPLDPTDLWETDRLHSLRSYGVLDTLPEVHYDELVQAAVRLCGTAGAMIGFVDRDRTWFKATHGMSTHEVPRQGSLCAAVVDHGAPLVVPDLAQDARFAENPVACWPDLVRSFVGVPIVGRDGLPLGAFGAFDRHPREFGPADVGALTAPAELTVALLELRRRDVTTGRDLATHPELTPVRLRRAIDEGEMVPFFQPVVDLRRNTVRGLEALVRWRHPTLGTLPPGRFLSALENTGLVLPLGRHMLLSGLRQLREWRSRLDEAEAWVLSVNVSPGQLTEPGLTDLVVSALIEHQIPGSRLELEITENRAFLDNDTARQELAALRAAGVRLALDDYGTGHSSLERLLDTPLTTLKLDRALVQRLPHDARAAAAVTSTLDLAAELGLEVVAEGVEEPGQLAWLAAHDVPLAQGFLFAHPVPSTLVPGTARHLGLPTLRTPSSPGVLPDGPRHGWSHEIHEPTPREHLLEAVDAFLLRALGRPVTEADPHPGAAMVIATAPHWRDLERGLRAADIDVDGHRASGRLTVLDPHETLPLLFRVTGGIDPAAVRRLFLPQLRSLSAQWGPVAAYGEMTALLWERGDILGCLELEEAWNAFAEEGGLSVCCRYPEPGPEHAGDEGAWARLAAAHTCTDRA